MKSAQEYVDSLRSLQPKVQIRGQLVKSVVEEPLLQPGINAVAITYEYAQYAEYSDIMLAKSEEGRTINRCTALSKSREDLISKLKMTRLVGRTVGCAQRYLLHDVLNALAEVTLEVDVNEGTEYEARFRNFLEYIQQEDLAAAAVVTDPKGDRSKRPSQQDDPDMYLRVIDRNARGITVRGAKLQIVGAPYMHELIILPTRAMKEQDVDYALSFATPVDTPGIRIVARPAGRPCQSEAPFSSKYGQCTAMIIFDDVFIPWERVFLCGEWKYAGSLVNAFSNHHRLSCVGARAGLGDMIIGASTLMAEYNGLPIEKVSHLKQKVIDLITAVESFYACGVTASQYGKPTRAGIYTPDTVYVNIAKFLMTRHIYDIFRLAQDISGGLLVTSPTPEDEASEGAGALIDKYLSGRAGLPTKERLKLARFLQDVTASSESSWYALISIHGGGSPEALRITALREFDMEDRIKLARSLAGLAMDSDCQSGCQECA